MNNNNSDNNVNWGTAVFLIFAGAAIGAAVSLLYAPQSGDQTRALIADKTGELKDRVVDGANQTVESFKDVKNQAFEKANVVKDQAIEKAKDVKELAAGKIDEFKGAAREAVHNVGNELQKV